MKIIQYGVYNICSYKDQKVYCVKPKIFIIKQYKYRSRSYEKKNDIQDVIDHLDKRNKFYSIQHYSFFK